MDHQKSKTSFSAILPVLILMVAAFWVSSAVGAEQKNILTSSKYFYIVLEGCLRYSGSESHVSQTRFEISSDGSILNGIMNSIRILPS